MLLDAISSQDAAVLAHVKTCADCRAVFEIMASYQVAGAAPLADAPAAWIEKAEAIATPARLRDGIERLKAALSFDSWALPAAAGVRSSGTTSERRLRFAAGSLSFDLRVEQTGRNWGCVGRLTGSQIDTSPFVVESNKLTVTQNEDGFYQWLSTVPPRRLRLTSEDCVIDLPEIAWRTRSQS